MFWTRVPITALDSPGRWALAMMVERAELRNCAGRFFGGGVALAYGVVYHWIDGGAFGVYWFHWWVSVLLNAPTCDRNSFCASERASWLRVWCFSNSVSQRLDHTRTWRQGAG
jgi:hypothetical protein